ncbi:MAG: hypothetical protein ABIB43_03720 [archaeon]
MSLVSQIKTVDEHLDVLLPDTKTKVITELIDKHTGLYAANRCFILESVTLYQTTFKEELDRFGWEKFLMKPGILGVFGGNIDLESNIEYMDKMVGKYYTYDS